MEREPIFNKIVHTCIVVKNLEEAIKKYEQCGIGPWEIHHLDSSVMSELRVLGEKADFTFLAAVAKIGDKDLELIQPLDDKGTYADFLRENGEGLHHMAFGADDVDETVAFLTSKGAEEVQYIKLKNGSRFIYLDAGNILSCIVEICDRKS